MSEHVTGTFFGCGFQPGPFTIVDFLQRQTYVEIGHLVLAHGWHDIIAENCQLQFVIIIYIVYNKFLFCAIRFHFFTKFNIEVMQNMENSIFIIKYTRGTHCVLTFQQNTVSSVAPLCICRNLASLQAKQNIL
jgi:hypothetical protein